MPVWGIVLVVLICILGFAVLPILAISYVIKEHKSQIKRAQAIDPTVKTLTEAEYVLKKDIARNISAEFNNDGQIFCKECGAPIDADSKFCKKCGKEQ